MRKNFINTGVFVKENISVASDGSSVSAIFATIYQTILMSLGIYGLLGCFLSCFDISVDYELLITGVVIIEILLLLVFIFKNVLWSFVGILAIFIFTLISRWNYIKYGFIYLQNAVVESFNNYVGTNIPQQTVRLEEDQCVAWVLIIVSFLLIMSLWAVIYKAKFKAAYYLLVLILFAPTFISGEVVAMLPLMSLITHIIAIAVMNRVPRGVTEGTELKPEPGKSVLKSFKVKTRIHNGAFIAALMALLLLISPLLFPESVYDSLDVAGRKKSIQDGINNFSMDDALESMKDFFNELGDSSLNPFNMFKNDSEGGLRGGELNVEDEVVFTYETSLTATVPRISESIYLKGYAGAEYTGRKWETLSKSDRNRYEEILELSGENYNAQGLPWNYMNMLGHSDISYANLHGNILMFSRYQLELEYAKANEEFLYVPYDIILDTSDNFFMIDDLYISPVDIYPSYELSYYMPSDELKTLLTWQADPEIISGGIWEAYSDFENEYSNFVHDIYTRVPSDLRRLKQLNLDAGNSVFSKVDAVLSYLRQNTEYTLAPGELPRDTDYIEYFLFDNQKGYCAHYASAAVMMLRNLGVPARYVEGYLISARDIAGGRIVGWEDYTDSYAFGEQTDRTIERVEVDVKDSNAHAWVEVYLDGYGWYPVEATSGYSYNGQIGDEQYRLPETVEPTPTPTPTPTPRPTNIPEEDVPENLLTPSANPTPTIITSETEQITPTPVSGAASGGGDSGLTTGQRIIFGLVLSLAVICIIILTRKSLINNSREQKYQKMSNKDRAIADCRNLFKLLEEMSIDTEVTGGYEEYISKMTQRLIEEKLISVKDERFEQGMRAVVKARFGNEEISTEEMSYISSAYHTIRKNCYEQMKFFQRLAAKYIKLL